METRQTVRRAGTRAKRDQASVGPGLSGNRAKWDLTDCEARRYAMSKRSELRQKYNLDEKSGAPHTAMLPGIDLLFHAAMRCATLTPGRRTIAGTARTLAPTRVVFRMGAGAIQWAEFCKTDCCTHFWCNCCALMSVATDNRIKGTNRCVQGTDNRVKGYQ